MAIETWPHGQRDGGRIAASGSDVMDLAFACRHGLAVDRDRVHRIAFGVGSAGQAGKDQVGREVNEAGPEVSGQPRHVSGARTLVRSAMTGSSSHDFRAQLPVVFRTERKPCLWNRSVRPSRSSVSSGVTAGPTICQVAVGRMPTTCPGYLARKWASALKPATPVIPVSSSGKRFGGSFVDILKTFHGPLQFCSESRLRLREGRLLREAASGFRNKL